MYIVVLCYIFYLNNIHKDILTILTNLGFIRYMINVYGF